LTQWLDNKEAEKDFKDKKRLESLKFECADIFIYLLLIADKCQFNLLDAAEEKIKLNEKRYPVEKSRNSAKKYSEL
jgi:NTP pyrophosphatase (non-canonical NTP hydrolase)